MATDKARSIVTPSWFLRIACERCGKERMISETHMPQRDMLIRDILDRGPKRSANGKLGSP